MKIILSPTKTMKYKALDIKETLPYFQKEADSIREILKNKDKSELKKLYKASDKIVEACFANYQNEEVLKPAITMYDGLVFKQLNLKDYDNKDLEYLYQNVNILSTLYGVLNVTDLISNYRLDYLMKFDFSLYEYWEEKLSEYFANDETIINLASSEYANSFKHNNVVNVHFVNKDLKTLATAAKIARGNMLEYLIKNKVSNVKELSEYRNLGYNYSSEHSDEHDYYFIMED